ncbi:MAG: phosphatidate cytidylyltransferase, partial [Pseudomonadota bacterium]
GLCGQGRVGPAGRLTVAATALPVIAAALGHYDLVPWILLAGLVVTLVVAWRGAEGPAPWYGLAIVYISLACIGFIWLRRLPGEGRELIFWLILVIWIADTGAYAAGRLIGGPKLAPKISPGKTWAGLFGGLLAAALLGVVLALFQDSGGPVKLGLLSGALALVAQGGDLLESMVKRRFGAKDSGSLIPGHGGILDRVDSLLLASVVLAAVVWLDRTGGSSWL